MSILRISVPLSVLDAVMATGRWREVWRSDGRENHPIVRPPYAVLEPERDEKPESPEGGAK